MREILSKPPQQSVTESCYHINHIFLAEPRRFGDLRLYQVGRLYCRSETAIAEHAHIDWFELTVATAGKGTVYTNGTPVPLSRGQIYLSFPWDHHAIVSDRADPLKYDFLSFSTEDSALCADLCAVMEKNVEAGQRFFQSDAVASLVSAAIAEMDAAGRHSERMLSSLLSQIAIGTVRAFLSEGTAEARRAETRGADALCYRMMHYIDTHIYTMDSLEELSAVTGYNYTYLSAVFRHTTGESLSSYYRRRRLETARLHIAENILSITAIAELLRYSSIYTFSRAFRDAYGVSPQGYRK